MNITLRVISVTIAIIVLSFVTGCAKKVEFFHGGMPDFKPGPAGGADFVDIKRGVDLSSYKMMMVEPLSMHFDSPEQYTAIPGNELKDLRNDFQNAIADALGDAYPIVDSPRPDTLLLRVLITGMVPSIPGASTGDTQWKYLSAGGASMKVELLDSLTRERIVAAMDTQTGMKHDPGQSMDKWVHARAAFKFWAGRLRQFLDSARGSK